MSLWRTEAANNNRGAFQLFPGRALSAANTAEEAFAWQKWMMNVVCSFGIHWHINMFMMTAKDQRISDPIQFSEQKVTHDSRRSGTHACLGLCQRCTALDTRRKGWKVPCHVQTLRGVNKLFYFWHEILSVDCLNVEKWGKVLNALLSSFPFARPALAS